MQGYGIVTSFEKKNAAIQVWENAGHIEWQDNSKAYVYFGLERVIMTVYVFYVGGLSPSS